MTATDLIEIVRRVLPAMPIGRSCRAWCPEPSREDHPFSHDPGDCRICWRPCRRIRRPGTAFCDECWQALAVHPAFKVRYALLDREDIPLEYIEEMTQDLDALISSAAENRLESFDEDDELLDDDPLIPAGRHA